MLEHWNRLSIAETKHQLDTSGDPSDRSYDVKISMQLKQYGESHLLKLLVITITFFPSSNNNKCVTVADSICVDAYFAESIQSYNKNNKQKEADPYHTIRFGRENCYSNSILTYDQRWLNQSYL